MANSLHEQRQALAPWFIEAREALDRHDWKAAFATYPRADMTGEPTPWAPAPADLRTARIAMISSSGIYAQGQQPYDAANPDGDYTWRALPADLNLAETRIAHDHYDHAAAEQDRNTVFPLERLRELVAAGEIGGLTPTLFSFMGYAPDWGRVMDTLAPTLAAEVAGQRPDAALLIPV